MSVGGSLPGDYYRRSDKVAISVWKTARTLIENVDKYSVGTDI